MPGPASARPPPAWPRIPEEPRGPAPRPRPGERGVSGHATAGAPAVPHSGPVSQDCPVECLRAVLPRETYLALARCRHALPWPPLTVGDVIRLRAGLGLAVVGGLGPSRIADIEAGLDRE